MSLIYPLRLNARYGYRYCSAQCAEQGASTVDLYTIDQARKLWPAVENTLMNCSETISRWNTNACGVSGEGTMRGRGGPITAAVDVPGGPILAGDHRRRDKLNPRYYIPHLVGRGI